MIAPKFKTDREMYKIDENGCWNCRYVGADKGYAQLWIGGKRIGAHRYFYEKHKQAIPKGMVIDH